MTADSTILANSLIEAIKNKNQDAVTSTLHEIQNSGDLELASDVIAKLDEAAEAAKDEKTATTFHVPMKVLGGFLDSQQEFLDSQQAIRDAEAERQQIEPIAKQYGLGYDLVKDILDKDYDVATKALGSGDPQYLQRVLNFAEKQGVLREVLEANNHRIITEAANAGPNSAKLLATTFEMADANINDPNFFTKAADALEAEKTKFTYNWSEETIEERFDPFIKLAKELATNKTVPDSAPVEIEKPAATPAALDKFSP